MKFIVLTTVKNTKVRINVQHIVAYYAENESTTVELSRDTYEDMFYVKETPEEIDELLIVNGVLVHGKD